MTSTTSFRLAPRDLRRLDALRRRVERYGRTVRESRADVLRRLLDGGAVPEDLLLAGAMLANAAFNLKQRNHLTADERRSLAEAQEAWDAARSALRGNAADGERKARP